MHKTIMFQSAQNYIYIYISIIQMYTLLYHLNKFIFAKHMFYLNKEIAIDTVEK